MKFAYFCLLHIRGLVRSSVEKDEKIFVDSTIGIQVILTSNPDPLCFHIDKSHSILGMIEPGRSDIEKSKTIEENTLYVNKLIDNRRKEYPNGLFLYFEAIGEEEIGSENVYTSDAGNYIITTKTPKVPIQARYEAQVRLAKLALYLEIGAIVGFKQIGNSSVFFDVNEKPIYIFNLQMGQVHGYLSRQLSREEIVCTQQLISHVIGDASLERIAQLLEKSLEERLEQINKFIYVWMALEIFINKTFNHHHDRFRVRLFKSVSSTVADAYFDRDNKGRPSSFTLVQKFVIVSDQLDSEHTETDTNLFKHCKTLRDSFMHGEPIDFSSLPVDKLQTLIRKLLRLYINSQ